MRKITAFAFTVIPIMALYAGGMMLIFHLYPSLSLYAVIILAGSLAIFLALGSLPFRRPIQNLVDRIFYHNKRRIEELTQKEGSNTRIVTAKILAITKQLKRYPWKLDVLIQKTVDVVGTLPNPVTDSVGKVVTVVADQDMTPFKINDVVTARIIYFGDGNNPSDVSFYMYLLELE
jgi:hypothetical protein